MKKLTVFTVAIVMLFVTALSVYALPYEHKGLYSIDIGEEYTYSEENSSDDIPVFVNADYSANININYIANDDNEAFANLTAEELESYRKQFKAIAQAQFAKNGEASAEINVYDVKTVVLTNGYTALVTSIQTTTSTTTLYQRLFQVAGENNIYTVGITSQNKKRIDELNNIMNTFKMTEKELTVSNTSSEENEDMGLITLVAVSFVAVVAIIASVIEAKRKKKRNKERLETPIQSTFDTFQSQQIQNELNNFNDSNNSL